MLDNLNSDICPCLCSVAISAYKTRKDTKLISLCVISTSHWGSDLGPFLVTCKGIAGYSPIVISGSIYYLIEEKYSHILFPSLFTSSEAWIHQMTKYLSDNKNLRPILAIHKLMFKKTPDFEFRRSFASG